MAVKIRLKRTGRRHRMSYRIVATDIRASRDGKVLEVLGDYNPELADETKKVRLHPDRVKHWLRAGAQPTDTVDQLLKKAGIQVVEVRAAAKAGADAKKD